MTDWPREIGGHLLTRDVQLDPESGDAGGFRCVECGEVFDDLAPERIRAEPCSQAHRESDAVSLSPGGE